jgi:hypothetical protein
LSYGCGKTIAACETVVDRNSTGFTVKCEYYCPVEWHGLTAVGTVILTFNSKTRRLSFNHCFTGSNCLTTAVRTPDGTISGTLTTVVRHLLSVKQWLTETRRVLLLNVRIIVPSSALTAVVRQLLHVKQ